MAIGSLACRGAFRLTTRAVEFLKHRQFLASHEFPAELATSQEFYPTLLATFAAIVPLVRFLNTPLVSRG